MSRQQTIQTITFRTSNLGIAKINVIRFRTCNAHFLTRFVHGDIHGIVFQEKHHRTAAFLTGSQSMCQGFRNHPFELELTIHNRSRVYIYKTLAYILLQVHHAIFHIGYLTINHITFLFFCTRRKGQHSQCAYQYICKLSHNSVVSILASKIIIIFAPTNLIQKK